jgi:large subunit ribosomal protein L32
MAVPKKRKSHSRTRTQRSHDSLTPRFGIECAQCKNPMVPHQVCVSCGYYRSREVIAKPS